MGKVTSRKGGARCSSSVGWDKVGWTEAAVRTFGAGHQGNPSRQQLNLGWLAGEKADTVTVGKSPAALSVSQQRELILSGHTALDHTNC